MSDQNNKTPPSTVTPAARATGNAAGDFIAKMEARRLAQPTIKIIDMRGRVPGKIREHVHNNITHYMDDRCIEIFNESLAEYNGRYTNGVYERVTNADHTYRAQDMRTRDAETAGRSGGRDNHVANDNIVNIIPFGYRPQRAESRLNYVSDVVIDWDSGPKTEAKTLDLSLLGVRLQLSLDTETHIGQALNVHFTELEAKTKTQFGPIAYTVVGIDKESERHIVRIKRQMRATEREFDRYIPYFIQTMSTRYKIELKDALMATYARVYEHMYARVVQYLHAYYADEGDHFSLLFCTGNIDHSYLDKMPLTAWVATVLPTHFDLAQLRAHDQPVALPQRVLALRLGSQMFALSADELRDHEKRKQWLQLCLAATETAAFSVVWRKHPKLDDGLRDQSLCMLPESLDNESRAWAERVSRSQYSAALVPVNSALIVPPDESVTLNDIPAWLQAFEINARQPPIITGMGLRGARAQERYLYRTDVSVRFDEFLVSGELIDFSINGLRIKLFNAGPFKPRDIVAVSFTALMNKIKEPSDLDAQLYRVIRTSHNGEMLYLERDFRVVAHKAARFFAHIIQTNLHKLPPCPAEQLATTEATLTEQMLAFGLSGIPLYFGRDEQKRSLLLAIGHNAQQSLLSLFKVDGEFDFSQFNSRDVIAPMLSDSTNNVGYVDKVKRMELLHFSALKNLPERWLVVDAKTPADMRLKLLREGFASGRLQVYAANVMPQPTLDRAHLDHELEPVMRNSRYKADVFRSELNRMVGVGELFDITANLKHEISLL